MTPLGISLTQKLQPILTTHVDDDGDFTQKCLIKRIGQTKVCFAKSGDHTCNLAIGGVEPTLTTLHEALVDSLTGGNRICGSDEAVYP